MPNICSCRVICEKIWCNERLHFTVKTLVSDKYFDLPQEVPPTTLSYKDGQQLTNNDTDNNTVMKATDIQESLPSWRMYQTVAIEASWRARCAFGTDALRFGVQTGEIALKQLLHLPHRERRSIVENGPYIDIYLGSIRVYKRISRAPLFASCPDISHFLSPTQGSFAACLPEGFNNALAVKLAVLYMELYLLSPEVRDAPWKVSNDFALYIYPSEMFAYIGMPQAASRLDIAIIQSMWERPLDVEQIRRILARECVQHQSGYAETLADNMFTFTCAAKIELFMREYDIKPTKAYEDRVNGGIKKRAMTSEQAG